jgi:hypothetical protein
VRVLPAGATQFIGWQILSIIANFGKTPATNAVIQFCDPIMRTNAVQPVLTCTISELTPVERGIIGPGQQQYFTGPTVDPQTMNDTSTETRFLYVFGYLTYRDDLLGKETHKTRFCHRILQRTSPSAPPETTAFLSVGCHDPLWNCIDNDCAPLPR